MKNIQMMPIGNGTEYCRQVYALKSGDELIMEFTDCKEDETALSPMQRIPAVMPTASKWRNRLERLRKPLFYRKGNGNNSRRKWLGILGKSLYFKHEWY